MMTLNWKILQQAGRLAVKEVVIRDKKAGQ